MIIGDALFGMDLWADAAEMARAAQSALTVLKKRVAALAPLPLWVPTGDNRRFNGAMRMLNERIASIVEQRRAAGGGGLNFLAMLMESRDTETGAAMSDRQLHEEFSACCSRDDTVGESLAWTWYLLSLHREVERRLHREIDEVLGDLAFPASPICRG